MIESPDEVKVMSQGELAGEGSTSVKNLKTKPILVIAIEIDSFNDINNYNVYKS